MLRPAAGFVARHKYGRAWRANSAGFSGLSAGALPGIGLTPADGLNVRQAKPGNQRPTEIALGCPPSTRLMKVREITASRGIEPFLYHSPISSNEPAEAP